ncbi:MAG TPA: nuclear transport factor 2 family protein [Solirubrobacteraceae bacterium]
MSRSPIEQLLEAFDKRDVDASMALIAPDCRMMVVDGRRVEGAEAVRELFTEFLGELRSTTHRIIAEWHLDDVWIAEVEATYELTDMVRLGVRPRAFVAHEGPDGLVELHAYGAHERPLSAHEGGDGELRLGGQWIPPL